MCVVDIIYRLNLNRTQIKIKFNQTPETDKFTSSLLSGKSCISSSCVHYERTLCTEYGVHTGLSTQQTQSEFISFRCSDALYFNLSPV